MTEEAQPNVRLQEKEEPIERDILSPEGVEERVKREIIFRITLTQGGKYRVYCITGRESSAQGIFGTLEEAEKHANKGMLILGSFGIDPKGTLDALLSSLKDK